MPIVVTTLVVAIIWLVCSAALIFVLGEVSPKNRNFTKARWVRLTMVCLGPVTMIASVIAVVLAFIGQEISIPDMIDNIRKAARSMWANN